MGATIARLATSRRLALLGLLCLLPSVPACRAIERPDELQTLAGDIGLEMGSEEGAAAGAGAAPGAAAEVESFPFVGSAFPGLGGRLHSSLCDPASDPYSTCI